MNESPPKEPDAVKPIRWPIYVYLLFDLCILALAGVYGYFAWAQWNILSEQAKTIQQDLSQVRMAADAAKRSADAAKQSAEAVERASESEKAALVASTRPYVVTDKVWLTARPAADVKATGFVKFINDGKLPALNFHAGGRFKVRDSLPGKLVASGQFPTSLDIMPGGSRTIETSSDAPLTEDDLEAVRNGEKRLYGYGILAYEDGFGNQIAEAFCQVYNWKDKTFTDCPQPGIETGESKAPAR
jgi:hypothetical protein